MSRRIIPLFMRRSFGPWSWDSGNGHLRQTLRVMDKDMRDMQRDLCRIFEDFSNVSPSCREFRAHEHETLDHPVVVEKDGSKIMQLRFDVRHFKPDEITIKTKNGNLEVEAKHEDKSDNGHVLREYCRRISIPEEVDAEALKPILTNDGVLTVEAPWKESADAPPSKETPLPITHE